jgi:quinol monooxygenase YgiN
VTIPTDTPKSSEEHTLDHVLIIHEVVDYPAWKKVFDAAATLRKNAGERSYQVLRYEGDANRIVHFSAWTSHANAKQFFQSPELEKIRQQAGVKSPDFIYLNQLESGVL